MEKRAPLREVVLKVIRENPVLGLNSFPVFEGPDGVGGRRRVERVGFRRIVEIAEAGEGGRGLERVRLAVEFLAAFVFLRDVAEDDDRAEEGVLAPRMGEVEVEMRRFVPSLAVIVRLSLFVTMRFSRMAVSTGESVAEPSGDAMLKTSSMVFPSASDCA